MRLTHFLMAGVGSNSFRVCDIALIRKKVSRSHAAVDGDIVNISRTNDMTLANPSGVSAMRLVYVSNGQGLHFLDRPASIQAPDQWYHMQRLLQECLRNANREQQYQHDRGWQSPCHLLLDDHLEMREG